VPKSERPFESLEEFHEAELEEIKLMFESGTQIAVTAAMDYSVRHELNPPHWAMTESVKAQCAELCGEPRHLGRSNGTVSRYRQDGIDFVRWDTVHEVRNNREILRYTIKSLAKSRDDAAREHRDYCEKLIRWARRNSFKCASLLLAGSPAFGGPDAVKTSFRTVVQNISNPASAMRYHVLDPKFLRKISTVVDPAAKTGRKVRHLFDLN
jgi:hypothetical protein